MPPIRPRASLLRRLSLSIWGMFLALLLSLLALGYLGMRLGADRLVPIVLRAPADGLKPGLYDIQFETTGTRDSGEAASVIEQSSFYVPN